MEHVFQTTIYAKMTKDVLFQLLIIVVPTKLVSSLYSHLIQQPQFAFPRSNAPKYDAKMDHADPSLQNALQFGNVPSHAKMMKDAYKALMSALYVLSEAQSGV